jgi:hypothetical protein
MNSNKEKSFDDKFRERIVADASDWKNHPAFVDNGRYEFKRSQLTAVNILDFLTNNLDISRELFAESIGLTLNGLNLRIRGRKNFSLSEIKSVSEILTQKNK